jgi:hypothetical protein
MLFPVLSFDYCCVYIGHIWWFSLHKTAYVAETREHVIFKWLFLYSWNYFGKRNHYFGNFRSSWILYNSFSEIWYFSFFRCKGEKVPATAALLHRAILSLDFAIAALIEVHFGPMHNDRFSCWTYWEVSVWHGPFVGTRLNHWPKFLGL